MYHVNGYQVLQFPGEIDEMIRIFQENNVKSYLEIGCKFGGSLWEVGKSLPKDSLIVGVDKMKWGEQTEKLLRAKADLKQIGHRVTLIKGDSTDPDVIRSVVQRGPFDACFIDCNHTLPYVTKDWINYGSLCRLVAFHDINWFRTTEEWEREYQLRPTVPPIEVPIFWNDIKTQYRHVEIKRDKKDNGIGVLWRTPS